MVWVLLGRRPLAHCCQLKLVGGANNIVVNGYTLELSVWINSCNRHSASSILLLHYFDLLTVFSQLLRLSSSYMKNLSTRLPFNNGVTN